MLGSGGGPRTVHPVEESSVVRKHSCAWGPRGSVGARTIDVVVHFQLPVAQVTDKEVDHLIQVARAAGWGNSSCYLPSPTRSPPTKKASMGNVRPTGLCTPTTSG